MPAWRRPHLLAAASLSVLLASGCSAIETLATDTTAVPAGGGGVEVLQPEDEIPSIRPPKFTRTGPITPGVRADERAPALHDLPKYYIDECGVAIEDTQLRDAGHCVYGATSGLDVAVIGDSKIGQWMPALELIAEREGWMLHLYSKSACAVSTSGVSDACASYVAKLVERLIEQPPDIILLSQVNADAEIIADEAPLLARVADVTKARLVVLADTPAPPEEVVPCLATADNYYLRCSFKANNGRGTPGLTEIAARVPGALMISMNDQICPPQWNCPPVVDGVTAYRRGSHLTKTFVEQLAPVLHRRLSAAGLAKSPIVTAPAPALPRQVPGSEPPAWYTQPGSAAQPSFSVTSKS